MAEMIMIRQDIDLSLTDDLTPVVIHAKQFDHMTRCICCALYVESALYELPEGVIVNCSGIRPDGEVFQYGSETAPTVVRAENGLVVLCITEQMTACMGKVPVDVRLLDGSGAVLGSFSLVLAVGKAGVVNRELVRASYSSTVSTIAEHITECYINDDGYLVMESVNGLGLSFRMDGEGKLLVYYNQKG